MKLSFTLHPRFARASKYIDEHQIPSVDTGKSARRWRLSVILRTLVLQVAHFFRIWAYLVTCATRERIDQVVERSEN